MLCHHRDAIDVYIGLIPQYDSLEPFQDPAGYREPHIIDHNDSDEVDWSRFAYVQYATNLHYLCNSVMLFERLQNLSSKADRLLLHANDISLDGDALQSTLLRTARDVYGAILKPIEVQHKATQDSESASE